MTPVSRLILPLDSLIVKLFEAYHSSRFIEFSAFLFQRCWNIWTIVNSNANDAVSSSPGSTRNSKGKRPSISTKRTTSCARPSDSLARMRDALRVRGNYILISRVETKRNVYEGLGPKSSDHFLKFSVVSSQDFCFVVDREC